MAEASKGFDLKSLEAKIALLFFAFLIFLILTPKDDSKKPDDNGQKNHERSKLYLKLHAKPQDVPKIVAGLSEEQIALLIKCVEATEKSGRRSLEDEELYRIAQNDHTVFKAYQIWYDFVKRYYRDP